MPKPRIEHYDTYSQASAHMGIPVDELRNMKRNGAPGFKHNRIYPGELLPWIEEQKKAEEWADLRKDIDAAFEAVDMLCSMTGRGSPAFPYALKALFLVRDAEKASGIPILPNRLRPNEADYTDVTLP